MIDDIPPPRRWEIPRTPVRVVEHVQLQVSSFPASNAGSGSPAPKQRTPVRVKTPVHPLAHTNKATPPLRSTATPILRDKSTHSSTTNEKLMQTGECGPDELRLDTMEDVSPPISISKGIYGHMYR